MAIREEINKRPGLAGGIVLGIIVLALVLVIMANRSSIGSERVARMYYSDDDGATYFADDTDKIFPFDHNGKQAYRAYVFQENDKPFVGFLSRYTDGARQLLLAHQNDPTGAPGSDAVHQARLSIEVKRPGDRKWVPQLSGEGQSIESVRAPDGGRLQEVIP